MHAAMKKDWNSKLLGIRAIVEPIKGSNGIEVHFKIDVGSYADPMFFTNPAVRKAIESLEIKTPNGQIGQIRYKRLNGAPSRKSVYEENFFPIGSKAAAENAFFLRTGAPINLHRIALRELLRHEGGKDVILAPSANHASNEFLAYLKRIKILSAQHNHPEYRYMAKDAVRKINTGINAWRKKNRVQKPPAQRMTPKFAPKRPKIKR